MTQAVQKLILEAAKAHLAQIYSPVSPHGYTAYVKLKAAIEEAEKPPPPGPQCGLCGSHDIGWDGWIDSNGEVCGGPYDNYQCMDCGEDEPPLIQPGEEGYNDGSDG